LQNKSHRPLARKSFFRWDGGQTRQPQHESNSRQTVPNSNRETHRAQTIQEPVKDEPKRNREGQDLHTEFAFLVLCINQDESHLARRVSAIDPGVVGAALDQDVSRLEMNF
jgi:hypothetical protein